MAKRIRRLKRRRGKLKRIRPKKARLLLSKLRTGGPENLTDQELGQLLVRTPSKVRRKARRILNIDPGPSGK